MTDSVRRASNTDLALGNDKLKQEIEMLIGIKVTVLKPILRIEK